MDTQEHFCEGLDAEIFACDCTPSSEEKKTIFRGLAGKYYEEDI